mgnify:FL=1
MSEQDAAKRAFKTVRLDGGEWCVEFLGHAFIADPEPNQKDAEWLVAELQKDYTREIDAAVAEAIKERDDEQEIGREFLEAIKEYQPKECWDASPVELYRHAVDDLADARREEREQAVDRFIGIRDSMYDHHRTDPLAATAYRLASLAIDALRCPPASAPEGTK